MSVPTAAHLGDWCDRFSKILKGETLRKIKGRTLNIITLQVIFPGKIKVFENS